MANDEFSLDDFDATGFDDGFGSDDDFGGGLNTSDLDSGIGTDGFESFDDMGDSVNAGSSPGGQGEYESEFTDTPDAQGSAVKKQALFAIIGGVVLLIVIMIVISLVNKSRNRVAVPEQPVVQQEVQQVQQNVNVDNIMSNGSSSNVSSQQQQQTEVVPQTSVNYLKDENNLNWIEVTDGEQVAWNTDYADMAFLVTGITHYARAVDANNNLVMKTTLTGSISGLTGTYLLDVPYSKGTKLVVGNSFTVHVQLGTYNGKTVVGEIRY